MIGGNCEKAKTKKSRIGGSSRYNRLYGFGGVSPLWVVKPARTHDFPPENSVLFFADLPLIFSAENSDGAGVAPMGVRGGWRG